MQHALSSKLVEFQKWLKTVGNTTVKVVNKEQLRCGSPPNQAGHLVVDFNPGKCSKKATDRYITYVAISASCLGFIFVIILVVVAVLVPQQCRIYKFKRILVDEMNELNTQVIDLVSIS